MIKNKLWYALQVGRDDDDLNFGTYNEAGSYEIAGVYAKMHPEKRVRIVVVDQGDDGNSDPVIIEERIIHEGE